MTNKYLKIYSLLIASLFLSIKIAGQTGPGGVGDDSNNRFWWAADDLSVFTDGAAVQVWFNKGGNTTNAIQNTASRRPSFRSTASKLMNGFPVLEFDGGDEYFHIPDNSDINLSPIYERTFHAVVRTGSNVSARQVIFEEGANVRGLNIYIWNGRLYMAGWNFANDDGGGSDSPWGFSFISTPISADTEYTMTMILEGNSNSTGSLTGFLNGCEFGQVNDIGRLYSHSGDIGLGAKVGTTVYENGRSNGTGDYFGGDIAEFIINNYAESNGHRYIIENYLAAKYGISSSCLDLYDEDDVTAGDYDYDVAGIGISSSGASNLEARGEGILTIGNPGGLGPNEYFIFGHDNGTLDFAVNANASPLAKKRLDRVWRVSELRETLHAVDVGSVDMEFDLSAGGCVYSTASLVLMVDTDNDGSFIDEIPISGASNQGSDIYKFTGISDLRNNSRFTLALEGTEITGDKNICEGESTDLTTSGGRFYSWNTGESTSSITVSPASTTIYSVTITKPSGCTVVSCDTVVVNPVPDAGSDQTLSCPNPPSTYDFGLSGSWTVLSQPIGANASVSGLGFVSGMTLSGNYSFQVIVNGCEDTVNLVVPDCCPVPRCIPLIIRIYPDL